MRVIGEKQIADCTVYVEQFAAYCIREPEWGIFHVVMSDGNWNTNFRDEPRDAEEQALAIIFDALTPSQRSKIAAIVRRLVP